MWYNRKTFKPFTFCFYGEFYTKLWRRVEALETQLTAPGTWPEFVTMSLKNNRAMTTQRWPTWANSQRALWPGTLNFCLVSSHFFFSLAVVFELSLRFPHLQHFISHSSPGFVCFCFCIISVIAAFLCCSILLLHVFNLCCVFDFCTICGFALFGCLLLLAGHCTAKTT